MINLRNLARLNVTAWLGRRSPVFLIITTLALFAGVTVVRFLTPPDFHLSVLWLVPVSFAAWFLSASAGWVAALVATVIQVEFDFRHHETPGVLFGNTVLNFALFAFFVFIFSEVRMLYRREQLLSLHDPLTGLLNHRAFTSVVNLESRRMQRHNEPLTLAYLDLDNFKAVNDEHGHPAGDMLLKALARTMGNAVRSTDFVARLGGDEFAVLLPSTDAESAQTVIGKLQQILDNQARRLNYPVTFSVGAVTFEQAQNSPEEMIRLADQAMYVAKQAGKNRVEYRVLNSGDS